MSLDEHDKEPEEAALDAALELLELMADPGADVALETRLQTMGAEMAPHVLAQAYAVVAEHTTREGRERVARLAPLWGAFLARGANVYAREELFAGGLLFRSAKQAERRAALVCFTGRAAGLFMPNVRFLDLIGNRAIDVVLLTSEHGSFGDWYLEGARSFHGSMDALRAMLAARGIRPSAYLGVSSGGPAAVYAAGLDGGAGAVALGCRFFEPGRRIPLAEAEMAYELLCACRAAPDVPMHNLFGAREMNDRAAQARLRVMWPAARGYPVPGVARHNPMTALAGRGQLKRVVDTIADFAFGTPVNFNFVTEG